ncbi:MAG: ribbon-helix-helix protein, CopG family [Chloroflexota bacterium]
MRVRLSVDVEPELKRRLKVTAALRNMSVKALIEQAIDRELDTESAEGDALYRLWMGSDLSRLGSYEPYQWQAGELDEGEPPTLERTHGR